MKTIETNGCWLEPVPGSGDWYYGTDYKYGDLYEAEEIIKAGRNIEGRELCLVRFPEGQVFWPVPKAENVYPAEQPVFFEGAIYILAVYFDEKLLRILRFDCESCSTEIFLELPLGCAKDCYNLRLDPSPLTITRQSAAGREFEIIWPEQVRMEMDSHDSFFLRRGDRLFFSRWHEEGEGEDYRYWEETIVRSLDGTVLEVLPGDVKLMPDGQLWLLKQS